MTLIFEPATITTIGPDREQFSNHGYVAIGTGLGYWIEEYDNEDDNEDEEVRKPVVYRNYIITHLASGYKMTPIVHSEGVARALIEALCQLEIDWHITRGQLVQHPFFPSLKQWYKETLTRLEKQEKQEVRQ